jgi:hypothetical protein
MSYRQRRNARSFASAQWAWDNMLPDDYWDDDPGEEPEEEEEEEEEELEDLGDKDDEHIISEGVFAALQVEQEADRLEAMTTAAEDLHED